MGRYGGWPRNLCPSPPHLASCLRECFPDELITMSQHDTIYFLPSEIVTQKETIRGSTPCTFEIQTTLIWISITRSYSTFFLCSFQQSLARGQEEASSAAQIASEWSARGFHTAEKLNNNCIKTGRLSPKCHVSLNESQRRLSPRDGFW